MANESQQVLEYRRESQPPSGQGVAATWGSVCIGGIAVGVAWLGGIFGLLLGAAVFGLGMMSALYALSHRHPLRNLAIASLVANVAGAAASLGWFVKFLYEFTCC